MIPSHEIRALCFPADKGVAALIEPFDSTKLGSYYYNLTVERIVVPGTSPAIHDLSEASPKFTLGPGRIVWLRMAERISTPHNMIASLEQTHHFTRMGLTFINLSLVFPNYSGYLTCAVANFSSSEISIFRSDNVARLTFSTLEKSVYSQKATTYTSKDSYDADLVREARNGDDTFFGLSALEAKIKTNVMNDMEGFARRVLWRYGLAGAALIIFFTILPVLQGIFTKTLYGDNIVTKAELKDALELMKSLEALAREDEASVSPEK